MQEPKDSEKEKDNEIGFVDRWKEVPHDDTAKLCRILGTFRRFRNRLGLLWAKDGPFPFHRATTPSPHRPCDGANRDRNGGKSAPHWTRTNNPLINREKLATNEFV